jgi:Sigma-70, region 4
MEGLSPREREVVRGVYLEEQTSGEVAERLSISEGAVERILLVAMRSALKDLARKVGTRRRLEDVIEVMLPESIPSPAEVWHAQRSAQARSELLEEFGALTAEQVADQAGSEARNRSALASRWHSEGRIFAVPWHGRSIYPAFKFRDARPSPTVERAVPILRERGLDGWPLALWFTTPTGWLWDRRPVDLLEEDPQGVLRAAGEALSLPA